MSALESTTQKQILKLILMFPDDFQEATLAGWLEILMDK